jgi:DNA polymerase III gamma/tau subunit
VLGLVRRDLLIEIADAIAREDATAVFALAGRAVESGYDLRLVVRELARLTRDLLVLSIDPSRVSDPEIAAEAERQSLLDLSRRFSGEDLMRAFDVLTKAEYDIRASMQPRYQLEMALLRCVHLRKLVPLTDLIQQVQSGGSPALPPRPAAAASVSPSALPSPSRADTVRTVEAKRAMPTPSPESVARPAAAPNSVARPAAAAPARPAAGSLAGAPNFEAVDPSRLKEAFLGEIRKAKKFFHGTVVAQAQRIDVEGHTFVFVFGPQHRALRVQLEQNRPWLEAAASQLAGHKMTVAAAEGTAVATAASTSEPAAPVPSSGSPRPADPAGGDRQQALKDRALADTGVQTMLDVFAAEIKDIEEM